ncbi:MAG: DUF1015 domain-containing protein [Bacteroidetes bacterium]|nr:DUF1015 domain-containing protein [Bacteroidota bacterium]
MPIVRPFRAIRPTPDKVHLVVSRSYIDYEEDDLRHKLASNPYSFIHIINPDVESEDRAVAGSTDFFHKVREKYLEFYHKGFFIQDDTPGFYVYTQSHAEASFTGIIATTASKDYADGLVKKHEQTLTKREKMFETYLDITGINAEPVLLSYADDAAIDALVDEAKKERPIYDFSTADEHRHTVWYIGDETKITALKEAFDKVGAFYIADGHHRTASSARLTYDRNGGHYGSEAPHDFFMSYLLPASQMRIHPFHRLIRTQSPLDGEKVLEALKKDFDFTGPLADPRPKAKGEMSIYMDHIWHGLKAKEHEGILDSLFCSEKILAPIFGIEDLTLDKRISFISGEKGIGSIMHAVDSGRYQLGIALFPATMERVFSISDRGETMPPKSTWVEPKLRSALTIYSLNKH